VSTQEHGRAEQWRRRFTDWGSSILGFAILGRQAFLVDPEKVSWPLLVTGFSLLGVQTGVALVSSLRTPGVAGITGTSSPSEPPSSSSPASASPPQP
jgi:hypothetical protein